MKQCENCNRQFPDHMVFCPFDGDILDTEVEDLLLGRVIDGKYRLEEKLGEGGMGTVYRAKHVLIQNDLAVKVLHSTLVADRHAVARFQREATAAARIKHPNAVGVTDFGRTDDEIVYIVMELFIGKSLRDVIENEGPMEVGRSVSIIRQVCSALDTAHRNGVIHRDVKPDNIVIEQNNNGQGELVKVLDFGIAKLKDGPSGEAGGRLTRQGVIIGSPHYLSPEQCQNSELDARSDIYSLGIVLYEMFTADVPFKAPTPIAVAMMHATEKAQPVREKRSDIPEIIERIVMKALDKNPENRQQSAIDLAQELEQACQECGIVVPMLGGTSQLPKLGDNPIDYSTRQMAGVQTAAAKNSNPLPVITPEPGNNTNGAKNGSGKMELPPSARFTTTGSMSPENSSKRLESLLDTPSFISSTPSQAPVNITPSASLGNMTANLPKFGQMSMPSEQRSNLPMIGGAVAVLAVIIAIGSYFAFSGDKTNTPPPTKVDPVAAAPPGMLYVKGGSFKMGINADKADKSDKYVSPEHEVKVDSFYIDKTEVTNQEYKKFIDAANYAAPKGWKDRQFPPGSDLEPVTQVTWKDANEYAKWAGKRLPTESEWEYAARGTDSRSYPWGDQWLEGVAVSKELIGATHTVGSLPKGASPFGVQDMAGNVWEWTADSTSLYPKSTETLDPKLKDNKIIRGGSFKTEKKYLTTYFRNMVPPDSVDGALGFRCVKSAQ